MNIVCYKIFCLLGAVVVVDDEVDVEVVFDVDVEEIEVVVIIDVVFINVKTVNDVDKVVAVCKLTIIGTTIAAATPHTTKTMQTL